MVQAAPAVAVTHSGDGKYKVSGALVFGSVRDALRASGIEFQSAKEISVDLSEVKSADSAGLALLIEWFCAAQRAKGSIRFVGAPAQLRALAKISEIESVLPFE